MASLLTTNETLNEIVKIVEDMPKEFQRKLLHQLKMKRAMIAARKIDAIKKPAMVISDDEIAQMVYDFRRKGKG